MKQITIQEINKSIQTSITIKCYECGRDMEYTSMGVLPTMERLVEYFNDNGCDTKICPNYKR